MALSEKLLVVIRLLWIVLMVFFILTAYDSYMIIHHIRSTVDTRLNNNEFPFPVDGLVNTISNDIAPSAANTSQSFDISHVKDADIRAQLSSIVSEVSNNDYAGARRDLGSLDLLLGKKNLRDAQTINQNLLTALDREDPQTASTLFSQLIASLSQ